MNIVITMAGAGSRFRRAGYEVPKYRIQARGRSLLSWSMMSLARFFPGCARPIFVAQAGDSDVESFIAAELAPIAAAAPIVITLERPTDGQATTALCAAEAWAPEAPLLIYNIDTHVDSAWLDPADAVGDGWIPCFRAPGSHWSFVRRDAAGQVVEVREKERISDLATIGLYWFASARLYRDCYDAWFAGAGGEQAGERYVAPIYNALIAQGGRVSVSEIPFAAVTPLGTPEELARFEAA